LNLQEKKMARGGMRSGTKKRYSEQKERLVEKKENEWERFEGNEGEPERREKGKGGGGTRPS